MDKQGLLPFGEIAQKAIPAEHQEHFKAELKLLQSKVQRRLLEPCPPDMQELAFQHSVLCQTGMPYRDPGDDVRKWAREQGNVSLLITAGEARDPRTHEWVQIGLPWGPKPRLILAHLNAEALRLDSPEIPVEDSLSAFVRRIRGFNGGREFKMFQTQLQRLSTAIIRLAIETDRGVSQINTQVVTGFVNLWSPRNEQQRELWSPTVRLSQEYFESLKRHAVPLVEADLAALAHTAMGLDLYCWLAQRLHRIDPRRPAFISWAALKEQFGADYARMDHFKPKFRGALNQVRRRYQSARVETDARGMTARHSPPPVTKRPFAVKS